MLDNRKEAIGVMPTGQALDLAAEQDVDLIMLNADASPPLVRLVQLNKLKYEQSKAEKDQRKKQRESRSVQFQNPSIILHSCICSPGSLSTYLLSQKASY